MQNQNTGYGFSFNFLQVTEDQKVLIEETFRRMSEELLFKFPDADGFGHIAELDQGSLDIGREVYAELQEQDLTSPDLKDYVLKPRAVRNETE